MDYIRAAFPPALYAQLCDRARANGFEKRGEQWKYLELMFTVLDSQPHLSPLLKKQA